MLQRSIGADHHFVSCPFTQPRPYQRRPQAFPSAARQRTRSLRPCVAVHSAQADAHQHQPTRRKSIQGILAAAGCLWIDLPALAKPPAEVAAQDDTSIVPAGGKFKDLKNDILAYEFKYPIQTANGQKLDLIFSRPPERYSSAAPLTADARQRTVAELLDLRNNVSVSVSVGPPSGKLKGRQPGDWKAKEVAETILADRSTARVTTGQRVALNQIETSSTQDRSGQMYWLFEHSSQGSPTTSQTVASKESYRHALAVTGMRPGLKGTPYLYTLNLSCPEEKWDELEPYYQTAIESFRLVEPSKGYVPPDKDPWRFW